MVNGRLLLQYGTVWWEFRAPRRVITAATPAAVPAALAALSAAVEQEGLYAAGYMSYEAAAGLDLTTHQPADGPPLLWFGLYAAPRVHDRLPSAANGSAPPTLGSAWQPAISAEQYRQGIAAVKEYIARGHSYQVNFTFPLHNQFRGDPFLYFHQLVQSQQAAYAAYLDLGRHVICSASPELFFTLEGKQLRSKPMKGTAARGLTYAADEAQREWLASSVKNRAENVMIVDMIRNDMGRLAATGSVHVPQLFTVERYPTLLQMTSTVEGQVDAPIGEILRQMFPCASITGAPKVRTMEIIRELEAGQRGVYTGAIGVAAPAADGRPRRAQFNVAIRTVVIDRERGTAVYGVGSGIVWDSDAGDEFDECRLKADVLTMQRPDFALLESLLWSPPAGYFLRAEHLRRLRQSAAYFQFPFDDARIDEALAARVQHLSGAHKVRLLLHRDGTLQLEAQPIAPGAGDGAPLRIGLAQKPVDAQTVWLYHKTTRRDLYDRARAERPECDEVLLWNEAGELTEGTTANLVLRLDGRWVTPPVESGLLAGTMRAALLAREEIAEKVLQVADLYAAEEIYLINSVRKWRRAVLMAQESMV